MDYNMRVVSAYVGEACEGVIHLFVRVCEFLLLASLFARM